MLALAEFVEVGEELGETDGGGFGSLDFGITSRSEGCDGKGHGDAVVGAGVDLRAVEALVAGDFKAVFVFGEGGSHGLQVFGYEGDAVGLFDAELAGVADGDAVDGVRGDGGEDGELVDDLRKGIPQRTGSFAGKTNLLQMAALLSLCDVGLTLDTGTMHVGRTVGLPMAIVAPAWSPPLEWLPLNNPRYRILKNAEMEVCPPDYVIDEVSVDEVTGALQGLLEEFPPASRRSG